VAVKAIFADFLKRVCDAADKAVVVQDTKGNLIVVGQPIDGATFFQDNFGVQTVEGKDRKVMLGFVLETRTSMSTLKWRMWDYLLSRRCSLGRRPAAQSLAWTDL
jgi:fructose-1,6-bisphosphatase